MQSGKQAAARLEKRASYKWKVHEGTLRGFLLHKKRRAWKALKRNETLKTLRTKARVRGGEGRVRSENLHHPELTESWSIASSFRVDVFFERCEEKMEKR